MARGTLRVLLCQEEFEYADDNNLSDWEEFGRSTHIFPVSTDKSNLSPIDTNIPASFFLLLQDFVKENLVCDK